MMSTPPAPLEIPERFAADTIAREGPNGAVWIDALPDRIRAIAGRWDLDPDGPVQHGYVGVVVPVTRDGMPLVLKVSWIDEDSEHEADALAEWDGDGAVLLVDADRPEGALLLERLDASTTLEALSPGSAIEVAGGLLRRLGIPAPRWARRLDDLSDELSGSIPGRWHALGRPFGKATLYRATDALERLTPAASNLLVNSDLHYENVLAGVREPWLVIDPKVVAGDLEFGTAQLLWQRFAAIRSRSDLDRRLGVLVEAAALDEQRARAWSLVRIVDYWLWALEEGFTQDPRRCETLVSWL